MPADLAYKIRRIRTALDLQHIHLADALDMTRRTYTEHENGRSPFTVQQLDKLAVFFKIPLGELMDKSVEELIAIIVPRFAGGGGRNPDLKKRIFHQKKMSADNPVGLFRAQ